MLIRTLMTALCCLLILPSGWAGTLQDVQQRGYLKCAVQAGHPGLASPDVYGEWKGFDTDFCRAIAAAVLADATRVMFVSVDRSAGIDSLLTGSADVSARTQIRLGGSSSGGGARHVGVLLQDSYGFLVPGGVSDLSALSDSLICVFSLDAAAEVVEMHLKQAQLTIGIHLSPALSDARQRYENGSCSAVAALRSDLVGIRARMSDPTTHHLLEIELGKAPAGPRVRSDDEGWGKVVQWVLFALLEAEALDLNSGNAGRRSTSSTSQRIRNLLGVSGDLGAGLGLRKDWVMQILLQVGNYAEIYARNIGVGTRFELPRTRSRLAMQGGMLSAPPAVAR